MFRSFGAALLLIALGNVVFLALSSHVYFVRPLINYDVIVAMIVGVVSWRLAAILLVLSWFAEFLTAQSFVYQFVGLRDYLRSWEFSGEIKFSKMFSSPDAALVILSIIGLIVALYAIRHVFLSVRVRKTKLLISLLVALSTCALVDAALGAATWWRPEYVRVPINVSGSPVYNLAKSIVAPSDDSVQVVDLGDTVLSIFDISEWARKNPNKSILFVVVESMGSPYSDNMRSYLVEELNIKNYHMLFRQVKTRGATTSGELRSLCGLKATYASVRPKIDKLLKSYCLPWNLRGLGWNVVGFHGFSGQMFDRRNWWSLIGIQNAIFADSTELDRAEKCGGAFWGTCDKNVLEATIALLKQPKTLVYVLTLNTHLPVIYRHVDEVFERKCRTENISAAPCMHLFGLHSVLKEIKRTVELSATEPLVIVVGDHPPPFYSKNERGAFHNELVPAFVLIPE